MAAFYRNSFALSPILPSHNPSPVLLRFLFSRFLAHLSALTPHGRGVDNGDVRQSLRGPAAHSNVASAANRKFAPNHFHPVVKTTSASELENRSLVNSEGVTEGT